MIDAVLIDSMVKKYFNFLVVFSCYFVLATNRYASTFSQLLSPQVTATPQKIEAVLRSVGVETPVVDLSWAVQSLLARKKLDFNEDSRFIKGSGIYSIKVKGAGGTEVRYEKGDTVKIRRNSKGDISHARITNIDLGERMLSVEILVRCIIQAVFFTFISFHHFYGITILLICLRILMEITL